MAVLLGCIADDFTGATDLANTLVKEGMRTVQVIGVPDGNVDPGGAEAVVVALKSRTCPVAEAVSDSLAALEWLRGQGARQFFFKYCSTFDSTPRGNIGPVADALMDALETDFAVVCPAFPDNGRTVFKGHLFVGDQLLSDSSMRDHPLTPMSESNLVRFMGLQSEKAVGLIDQGVVSQGAGAISDGVRALTSAGAAYGVVDAIHNDDLREIGRAAAGHQLITGGSGVALGLPDNFRRAGLLTEPAPPPLPQTAGRAAVFAGSCSEATRGQIAHARTLWPSRRLDIDRIVAGEPVVEETLAWAAAQSDETPVLIYGSADPAEVTRAQAEHGPKRAGDLMEKALGRIARDLVNHGARRIIVAGGETSGAVVSALAIHGLRIGPEIDPGVPWTETLDDRRIALALKSGNFGTEDFFIKALEMLS